MIGKILCIRSDRLGEFLLTLYAIKLIKENYPTAELFLLAQSSNIELIRGISFIDRYWEYRSQDFKGCRGVLRLASFIRKSQIDVVIIFNPKKEFHLASLLGGSRFRVGYDRKWGFCLNRKIKDRKDQGAKHEVEYNIELVRLFCDKIYFPAIDFPVDGRDTLEFLKDTLGDNRYIIIHLFTSDPKKKLNENFWEDLTKAVKEVGRKIIVIGSSDDEAELPSFIKGNNGIINLVGKLSLRNLATLFKYFADCFIGLDSGPMHLAAILNIPVVGIFTTTRPTRWRPWRWSKEVLVVKVDTSTSYSDKINEILDFIKNTVF